MSTPTRGCAAAAAAARALRVPPTHSGAVHTAPHSHQPHSANHLSPPSLRPQARETVEAAADAEADAEAGAERALRRGRARRAREDAAEAVRARVFFGAVRRRARRAAAVARGERARERLARAPRRRLRLLAVFDDEAVAVLGQAVADRARRRRRRRELRDAVVR